MWWSIIKLFNLIQKVTLSLSPSSIVVIESREDLNSRNIKEEFNAFGYIYLHFNSHIEKIILNEKSKSYIKVITRIDLLNKIDMFEHLKFEDFFNFGLPKNISNKALIAIVFKYKTKKAIKYFDFVKKHKKNNKEYFNIPIYHEETPEDFSLFCTEKEKKSIETYIKKYRNKIKEEINEKEEENKLIEEISPSKENYLCKLCACRFHSYDEHLNSSLHKENLKQNENLYNRINSTFSRIVNYYNQKENYNLKSEIISVSFSDSEISTPSFDFNTQSLVTTQNTNPSFELFKTPPLPIQDKVVEETQKVIDKRNINQYLNENKNGILINHAAYIHMSQLQNAQILKYYQKKEKLNKKKKLNYIKN